MAHKLSSDEFKLFRNLLEDKCGLLLEDGKEYLVETRLDELISNLNLRSFRAFLNKIEENPDDLVPVIIDLMTTHETFWFRDECLWNYLYEKLVPTYIRALDSEKRPRIRIWSAASSSGQEAYSIAIVIHELLEELKLHSLKPKFYILASDISKSVINKAKNASYEKAELERGINPLRFKRYFKKVKDSYLLSDEIREMVEFKQFNLMDKFSDLGFFDLVFLRNVSIYFADWRKKNLINNIENVMMPDGILVLGASEDILDVSSSFEIQEHKNASFYKLKRRSMNLYPFEG